MATVPRGIEGSQRGYGGIPKRTLPKSSSSISTSSLFLPAPETSTGTKADLSAIAERRATIEWRKERKEGERWNMQSEGGREWRRRDYGIRGESIDDNEGRLKGMNANEEDLIRED